MISISFRLHEAIQKDPETGKKLSPSKEKETPVYMIFGYGWSKKNAYSLFRACLMDFDELVDWDHNILGDRSSN